MIPRLIYKYLQISNNLYQESILIQNFGSSFNVGIRQGNIIHNICFYAQMYLGYGNQSC